MMGQLLHDPVKNIELTYKGAVSELNTNPMSAAALAGLLKTAMPEVNMVSAPVLAKERGIELKESFVAEAERADSLIRIMVETAERKFAIVGTIYRGEPRIVRLFGVPMDAAFDPHLLYIRNDDKPGFIGKLGNLLGEAKVNIATFYLGRMDKGGEAVCLVSIDSAVPEDVQNAIKDLDDVKIVDSVEL